MPVATRSSAIRLGKAKVRREAHLSSSGLNPYWLGRRLEIRRRLFVIHFSSIGVDAVHEFQAKSFKGRPDTGRGVSIDQGKADERFDCTGENRAYVFCLVARFDRRSRRATNHKVRATCGPAPPQRSSNFRSIFMLTSVLQKKRSASAFNGFQTGYW